MIIVALLLSAQVAAQDPRLERLDPDTRSAVVALMDSARGDGLPVEPLIQRALEGATKSAPGARIIAAVRRLTLDLGTARTALGTDASSPELEAGVAALRAGATPQILTQLRTVRRPPLTMALSVFADLVASGVPADSAAAAVLTLAPKARDADLVEFRRAVEHDIALGAPIRVRTLALIALACGAAANSRTVGAQVTANVEAGISDVRYDGFLASGAASIAPTLRWEQARGRGFFTARGTYLRFESGRRSLDASANASWFTPLGRQWRGELGATAGASDYANIARFSHGQADARLHWMNGDHGGWVAATAGSSAFGGGPRPVFVVTLGTWLLRSDKTVSVSVDRSRIGDTAYTDLRSAGRWRSTGIVLEGTVGARFWSRGGGRGVFGDGRSASAHVPHRVFPATCTPVERTDPRASAKRGWRCRPSRTRTCGSHCLLPAPRPSKSPAISPTGNPCR